MFGPDLSDYAGMVVSTDNKRSRDTTDNQTDNTEQGLIMVGIAVVAYWWWCLIPAGLLLWLVCRIIKSR